MPVDMSLSYKENITTGPDDMSALHHVRHTPGYSRLIYGVYSLLGIIFYGIGIYTALGILLRSLNGGPISSLETILFLCYLLVNSIIGYGFMFCRKWLISAFLSTLTLTGLLTVLFFISDMMSRATALLTGVFMVVGILLFLFLTRRILSGRYLEPKIIIPFIGALLFSFLLTNFGVLH